LRKACRIAGKHARDASRRAARERVVTNSCPRFAARGIFPIADQARNDKDGAIRMPAAAMGMP
jgi:hypothetical protein